MFGFGGFLNSSFWSSYQCPSSASIEDLLNNNDCSVEKLLEDDDVIQEFKNYNEKLIGYFDHERLKHLIEYITLMPEDNANHNRGHKFPFVASEIFNCEINQLLDKFFEAPPKKEKPIVPLQVEEDEETKTSTQSLSVEMTDGGYRKDSDASDGDGKDDLEDMEKAIKQASEDTTQVVITSDETTEEVKDDTAKVEDATDVTKDGETTEQVDATEVDAVVKEVVDQVAGEAEDQNKEDATAPTKEEDKNEVSEKDLEDLDKPLSSSLVDDDDGDATQIKRIEEPEPEEEEDLESTNKYVLLDKLFLLIRTDDTPLNSVLAGYFTKLVSLLITRKQSKLIPYVFSPGSDVLDRLLYHVYQKSISELLNKFMTLSEHDFEGDVANEIPRQQQNTLEKLINKLGPESSPEDNLNASTIIQDLLETKESYSLMCKQENISRITQYAFGDAKEGGDQSSLNASLAVLNAITHWYNEKHKSGKKQGNDDDDDIVIDQNDSDGDEVDKENKLIDNLKVSLRSISAKIDTGVPQCTIETTFDSSSFTPLGHYRLRIVELVNLMLKLENAPLHGSISESGIFTKLSELVEAYPWNNFLQLKVISIYEEIFENSGTADFRKEILGQSNFGETILKLQVSHNFELESTRFTRNGHMALVIKIANLLIKHREKEEVTGYLESLGTSWESFVGNQLQVSNEFNSRNLGGQQPKSPVDDEDDNSYEVNMEKIMARFSNFNSQSSSNNGPDEEEEDEQNEDEFKRNNDDDELPANLFGSPIKRADEVEIDETFSQPREELDKQCLDNSYWQVAIGGTYSLDDLMKEMQ